MAGHKRAPRRYAKQSFRIIAGHWRGRRLQFPAVRGIRPSPDRVRETAFNWLAPRIAGTRCLDLYCGSGALGLEALSRGAGEVVMIDREAAAVRALGEHLQTLGARGGQVLRADALAWLAQPGAPFDIVFLDPPFGQGLLPRLCKLLEDNGHLKADARIYLECEAAAGEPALPSGWTLLRSRRAGQVGYHLARNGHDDLNSQGEKANDD